MIPRTKEKPKRENFKSFDKFSDAMVAWRKSKPKAGSTKTVRKRKGNKYITTKLVWNGSRWVKKGDSSLVPSRAGKDEGNTTQNKNLKIKAQYEKDKKIPKVKPNNGTGNGGSTKNGETTKNGGTTNNDKTTKNGGTTKQTYVDIDAADKNAEKVFRNSSSVQQAKDKHAKAEKLKIGYRRTKGEGIEKKGNGYRGDTRITKKLKKSGFTETRLAKLREKNDAFQKAKKGGKKAMEAYRKKYPKRG